ncbi:MAG TPA: sulfite reductase flavoprotein subunit alpha [Duganella sp.]|nr:sulfite reductase flavoprotein subunit alpha [Duganella sp.]
MKKLWFQLHWFVGITAGTVLMVIGLTGAALAFREQILDALNPGVRNVAVQSAPVLGPQQIMLAAKAAEPHKRITTIMLYDTPGASARVSLAPQPGQRKGETIYLNPYTGALMPELAGEDFFEWVEQLHRFLLLPRDPGKMVSGTLAFCLMGLALSGLYLRWPRRVWDWRTWLTFDLRMKGRSFLWGLHSVAGTWVMVVFLMFTASGVYWAFDPIRDMADGWMGTLRPPREAAAAKPKVPKTEVADLSLGWESFKHNAPDWQMAVVRVPERATQPLQIQWVAKDAPHLRARSSMSINLQTGALLKNELYADKPLGARFQSTIYPLHLGTYFGVTGQIIVFIAALALPGFGITGWMLYLNRRKQKRIARAERAQFAAVAPAGDHDDPVLMAYASQTGQAERLALQSAAALRKAGVAVHVHSLEDMTLPQLGTYRRALFVASSFGDGEAPDSARRFSRLLQAAAHELKHLQYAVLALGDRNYTQFCGFGHTLDQRLSFLGAQPLHPIVEVDNGDAGALARWGSALRGLMGGDAADVALNANAADSDYTRWRLMGRILLNPGSVGEPLYEITLHGDIGAGWCPGALVDIWPGHYGKDAAPRRYSLASVPQDGCMQLVVRKVRGGLASGWLTTQAAIGDEVRVRLVANPSFDAYPQPAPAIYIGNGSGIAGLRSHLRARVREGAQRNWLIFGERQQQYDAVCAEELQDWRERGFLPELDLVYSRDANGGGYVQDRMRERADTLREWIDDGAVIYVCGSQHGMAGGVDDALADIIGRARLAQLLEEGRYRRDIY